MRAEPSQPLSKPSISWWSVRCGNYLNNRLLQNFVPSTLQTYALEITISLVYVLLNIFFLNYFPFVFLKQQPIYLLLSFFQHCILSYSLLYLLSSLHSNHPSNHVISSTISIFFCYSLSLSDLLQLTEEGIVIFKTYINFQHVSQENEGPTTWSHFSVHLSVS